MTPYSLKGLLVYFLTLGATGFGGPAALVAAMQRDLVEARGWITPEEYREGLALAQLAPGPLAAQLAIYLGWVRAGLLGATLVALAFILPSFAMVLALAALYVRFGGLPGMQALFYGVGASVIALTGLSAWKLVRVTVLKDRLMAGLCLVSALVTAWTEQELVWLILGAGLVALFVQAPPRRPTSVPAFLGPSLAWLVTGLHGPASLPLLGKVGLFFATAGSVVFGSGLAIVPFLHGSVVDQNRWLTEAQFLDAVAVAMITPGPVVITVAFIGYLVAGPLGAAVAALGVFLPCYLFVVLPARYFTRATKNPQVKAFVNGVTAAATGAIAGAVFVLGRRALTDLPAVLIALATLGLLLKAKRLPEPLVIVAAGLVGLLVKTALP